MVLGLQNCRPSGINICHQLLALPVAFIGMVAPGKRKISQLNSLANNDRTSTPSLLKRIRASFRCTGFSQGQTPHSITSSARARIDCGHSEAERLCGLQIYDQLEGDREPASASPIFASVQCFPVGETTRAPFLRQRDARGMSEVTHTSVTPMRSAIQSSAASALSPTRTILTFDVPGGRIGSEPLETTKTLSRRRVVTR